METCAVIQEEHRPRDVTVIAPILAELLGLVPFDTVKQVREAHGIVAADRRPADAADPDFGNLNEFTQYNRWLLQMLQIHAGGMV